MTEIEKFYNSFNQEVATLQLSEENGESQEQSFTRVCLDMLTQVNETSNAVVAYDEKGLGAKGQHKVNGYAISENCDTIDLFLSIFTPSDNIESIEKAQIDRGCIRITNFFLKSFFNNYENEIAETSSIFEFAHQLATSQLIRKNLIRVNAFILTNNRYKGEVPLPKEVNGHKIFYNIIDIEKLYSISAQSRLPIQLDLAEYNIKPSCLPIPTGTEDYDGYLTFLPGRFLALLYEQYGFKLLEQNVRSFLQFRAGINRGIKETIMKRPQMFFAFNNGISATADKIELDETKTFIRKIDNLQIVNGGQTTATLFHTSKEAKDNIDHVLVPVKISVINNSDNSYEIVKYISKFANTQNKINDADLSANDPILVEIEKMSRYMLTPITGNAQHYWFFDRISKQYDNLLTQNSKSKTRKKAFELKYPKACKFTKYELAKFYNSYCELEENGKIVVGPHCVVDGNEVNFRAFRDYVIPNLKVNQVFYEDLIAKAILFKVVDKIHGTKKSKTPPIGDMKQVMVPYSIALLKIATNGCLDLAKIWKKQQVSEELSDYMYNLMVQLNQYLIDNTPRSNIIEWATKEDCWIKVKSEFQIPDTASIKDDVCSKEKMEQRYATEDDFDSEYYDLCTQLVSSIDCGTWQRIAEWGKDSGCLSLSDQNYAKNIAHKLKFDYDFNIREIEKAVVIYEITCRNNYELFTKDIEKDYSDAQLSKEQVIKMLAWEKTLLILDGWQFKIIQQSILIDKFSKFREKELLLIKKKLIDNGLEVL
ncbi:hypothetical protein IMSAG025_00212 [Muribaculaceae bacterium]|nr:hypothetical protein IMSAGC016_01312 [Muribaculaceae bacterium]GFI56785.1 hypothetical protein IMSAG025_00212 [Muribaculaceae bacterium]